jgi:hypothetical protein
MQRSERGSMAANFVSQRISTVDDPQLEVGIVCLELRHTDAAA